MKTLRALASLRRIDAVSRLAARGGALALAGMVALLGGQAALRLLGGERAAWSVELVWMAMAAAFLLGLGQAVRVDRFAGAALLPARLGARIRGAVELCALAPLCAGAAWFGWDRAIFAFLHDRVDPISDWGPKLWPFLTLLAVGLTLFALQLGADGLRRILGHADAPGAGGAGRRDRA